MASLPITMHYGLHPHVHLAEVDGDLVLMDARQNEYFCIACDEASGVVSDLKGSNRFPGSAALHMELEAAGLYGSLDQPRTHHPILDLATADIFADEITPIPAYMLPRLSIAAAQAWWRLRVRRPEQWLTLADRRRARFRTANADEVRRLAQIAFRARALFPGAARCLPNSMLLLELLAMHGLTARWVFGVRTHPFDAHCWVEHEGTVLNDSLDHVRWYRPIAEA